MSRFKVRQRVRVTEQGLYRSGDFGTIIATDGVTAEVQFDGGAVGEFAVQHIAPVDPGPTMSMADIHGEGEPGAEAAADAVDKADERERRIVAAKEAVVEAAMAARMASFFAMSKEVAQLQRATNAYAALLTPPTPADPVAELREAAQAMLSITGEFSDAGFTVPLHAMDRLRAAIAALGAQERRP